ncbi:MAG: hypothetical protein QG575_1563, partial [Euryarchaeota archaeon]|nr:hypothetical protein [Euryarchaeota archaeon]
AIISMPGFENNRLAVMIHAYLDESNMTRT